MQAPGGPAMPFNLESVPDYAGLPPSVVALLVIVTGIAAAVGAAITGR